MAENAKLDGLEPRYLRAVLERSADHIDPLLPWNIDIKA